MTTKTIFVAGGTGRQGSAAVRWLLQEGFDVKVLTRNTNSTIAGQLENSGAEMISGNLDKVNSYREHLKDIRGVFCVLTYDEGVRREIEQGKKLIKACRDAQVPHFVYSSVIGADAGTHIPHWESKYVLEQGLGRSGIPFTIMRPSSLYENFLFPEVRSRIVKGKLVTPIKKEVVQQFVSAEDVGRIAALIFKQPEKFLGRTFSLACEECDMDHVAALFTEVLGRPIVYERLPMLITRLVMGSDNTKMFKWVNRNNALFVKDVAAVKQEFPFLIQLKDWIAKNANRFNRK